MPNACLDPCTHTYHQSRLPLVGSGITMLRSLYIVALFSLFSAAWANKAFFDNGYNSQVCSGMYSKHDWGGSIRPHIDIKLNHFRKNMKMGHDKVDENDIHVSYVIFEYKDIGNLGYHLKDGSVKYICDDYAISRLKACNESQKGKFIINNKVTNSTIMTNVLTHKGQAHINYTIARTGYYCVSTIAAQKFEYSGVVNFQNAFGQLSASEIPKLPAYGILTVCYMIAVALYGFQFFKKRKDNQILPLQKYLLAMLGLLTFDTLVVWSYYDLVNRAKNPLSGFVTFYMVFLSLLNSAKITFSFFLLLCIGLGYGVVVLKLDKKIMFRCKLLAGAHFVATLVYLIPTYYSGSYDTVNTSGAGEDTDIGGILGLLPMIPVTITLTTYYFAILISIRTTTANLHQQRQIIKLKLYEHLFRIIFFSVVLTFGGLILSTMVYLSMSSTEMIEQHWKSAFFLFEFWPSVVFFAVFLGISWLWRPTETSYMLAISQQVSSFETENDDGQPGYHHHEFELDDMSLMSHSDDEGVRNDEFDTNQRKDDDPEEAHTEVERRTSNTLFELGSDEEHEDDRLDNSKNHRDAE